jgi:hypothetical protein
MLERGLGQGSHPVRQRTCGLRAASLRLGYSRERCAGNGARLGDTKNLAKSYSRAKRVCRLVVANKAVGVACAPPPSLSQKEEAQMALL